MQDGFTPLYTASQEGHTAVVSVLIDGGATVDLPDQVQHHLVNSITLYRSVLYIVAVAVDVTVFT